MILLIPGVAMSDLLHNIPLAFGLVFGALLVLIGLLLAAVGAATLRSWFAAFRWPRVTACIVSSEVRTETRFEETTMYRPEVTYTFAAGGGTVTGRRLTLAERLYPSEGAARRVLDRFPVGMVVTARHHPDNPAEAILEHRGALGGTIVLLMGVAMIAGPLAAAAHVGLPVRPLLLGIGAVAAPLLLLGRMGTSRLRRVRRSGLYPLPGQGSDEDVERLLYEGEKMLAIRLYRELHGCDLKTARQEVSERWKRLRGGKPDSR